MTLTIRGRDISRVCIVDDDPRVRDSYRWTVEDLSMMPIPIDGPLGDLVQFVEKMQTTGEASICDYMLRVKNYATFNGAELVAQQYRKHFPAVLCTRWETGNIAEIRRYRRYIPALLKPDELDPDSLMRAFECCVEEFHDQFRPIRRPWRSVVRVEYVDREGGYVGVIVSGWDPQRGIKLLLADLPPTVQERVADQERFFAQVNIGAEANEDLYFEDWQVG